MCGRAETTKTLARMNRQLGGAPQKRVPFQGLAPTRLVNTTDCYSVIRSVETANSLKVRRELHLLSESAEEESLHARRREAQLSGARNQKSRDWCRRAANAEGRSVAAVRIGNSIGGPLLRQCNEHLRGLDHLFQAGPFQRGVRRVLTGR